MDLIKMLPAEDSPWYFQIQTEQGKIFFFVLGFTLL